MRISMAFTVRSFLFRLALAAAIVLCGAVLTRAGGPKCVAGSSYFDPSTTGRALTWPLGLVTYYTDQGDLSPLLPNASANSLVASAFSQWTSVPTAGVALASGGQLAEDVNATNVNRNSDGSISMPVDIQSTATGTPVGIVYDYDGAVTDALLGSGAGSSSQCFSNAVISGNDNYGSLATYQHALIVINGQCAQQSSQLADVEYRLVRAIGGVLGVGWSQVNPNVITGNPHPTSDDYAGFPVMHNADPTNCVPITLCYTNPYQLSMDDVASLSRLYPVTAQNLSGFPGKQVFSTATARIHGTVWFTDAHGNATQPMQGVNVVARWIDPHTGLPSRKYAAASVSGFLFTGNEGNPITGFDDGIGDSLSEWGADNQAVEGFFDLAGLQLPTGGSAQYQLSVEAVNSTWSANVGSYSPGPVSPSGSAVPINVTVSAGSDVAQDILMTGAAQPFGHAASAWTTPAALPPAGDWESSLNYDENAYFALAAQANRTLSIAVTAMDESGNSSVAKAQPVIGMWAASDPQGTSPPAFTPSPFNVVPFGMTRLDAQVATSTNFLIGISDLRGDGRPDFRYHAYVLYANAVSPPRVPTTGGLVAVTGTGFHSGLTAKIGNVTVTPLAVSAGQMLFESPAFSDGLQDISLSDPVSGGNSVMTGALTLGAAATDKIVLLNGLNPPTAVGAQAANPAMVQVLAADGVTPVVGATVAWSASNGLQLSACGGASSCSVTTTENGIASTSLTPAAIGVANITATLAPGVYSSSPSVSATLNATESATDLGMATPYLSIAQGASIGVPVTVRVLSAGVPQGNATVSFSVVSGSGTLSTGTAQTGSTGYATVTLTVTQISAPVQVSACVTLSNTACQPLYVTPVPAAQQNLLPVSGAGQVSTGQTFQPVIVEVTDSSSPPNPVIGASVIFQTKVERPGGPLGGGGGETNSGNGAMPVILKVSQLNATTDINGLAAITPSGAGFSAPVVVDVTASAGTSGWLDYPLQIFAPVAGGNDSSGIKRPMSGRLPVQIIRPITTQER